MRQRAPEGECDTPCQAGPDAESQSSPHMCGGAWRNSVYALSTTFWENPGFDDRGWQSAADLGLNGVAPWMHRPSISENAHWIWTADAGANVNYNYNNNRESSFHDNTPGASIDEAGNCFLRQNCVLQDMAHGNVNCGDDPSNPGNCNPGNTWEVPLRQIFLLTLSPFRSTDLFGGAGTS